LGLDWKALEQKFESLHAPLGRWAPLAASALFAGARFAPYLALRVLLYMGASIMAILVAIDIARSLLEVDSSKHEAMHAKRLQQMPVTAPQVFLALGLTLLYTFLIFLGIGLWTQLIILPFIFAFASVAAWRNARLWFEQGEEYLEERAEVDEMLETKILKSRETRKP
jgi:hypothetical protein